MYMCVGNNACYFVQPKTMPCVVREREREREREMFYLLTWLLFVLQAANMEEENESLGECVGG